MIEFTELALRLFLATLIGGIIGFEREINNRPAGLRTHILVTLGSCLIMIISIYGFVGLGEGGHGGEPARLAAQVVSGIGFLGAGTILREGSNIKGLTTAASLWISGGIGLTIGVGFYLAAFITTFLALFSLIILRLFEGWYLKEKKYKIVKITAIDRSGLLRDISSVFGDFKIDIRNIYMESQTDEVNHVSYTTLTFYIKLSNESYTEKIYEELRAIEGISSIYWDNKEFVILKKSLNL